jgi:parvin
MSITTESSSFLSNTLKRRQQKRHEVTKVLQEGISSLHLSNDQQLNEGIYPFINIDPESYLLDEGDERSMLEPNSYNNPDFKQTINVLFNWINSSLNKDSIIVRSFENDLYDGYILGKLIEFYQPNIRLLYDEIPLSEDSKKKTLQRVINYLDICLNQPIKWTFEQIYNRDFIAILHLLLTLMKFFNIKTRHDLPKNLILKIIIVKKFNGLLQTKIVNECFIDDHQRELTTVKQGDIIDALFDLAPDKLSNVEKILLNFLNNQLNLYNIYIKQINIEDFQDGLYLLYLISHLENYFLIMNKYNYKKPITREQSYANLQLVFQLINQSKIKIKLFA